MNPHGVVAGTFEWVDLRPDVDALTGSLAHEPRRSGLSNASGSHVPVLRTMTCGPRSRALPLPPAESVARERLLALTGVRAERTEAPAVTASAEDAPDERQNYLEGAGCLA
jgi:hypothetical protein